MDPITVVIPTSPIPSHPSTRIIKQTIDSVLSHLPECWIIVTCDGVKADALLPVHEAYREYIKRLHQVLRPTDLILTMDDPVHQSGMLIEALRVMRTPLMLYLEHDWELLHPIEWEALAKSITEGEANYIKLYQGNRIHPVHEHMMLKRAIVNGVPLISTVQYSANPHLARTEWYRELAFRYLNTPDYIENLLHGPIANAPWSEFKCAIYNPIEGDMKRTRHLDGAHSLE